jgi:very-short-patch-repair endonuclease
MNEITEEQAKETLKKSTCRTDWAKLLGFKYFNGPIGKKLNSLIDKYNLDCSHFDLGHKKRKYEVITKICPVCTKPFKTQLGHKREKTVCSRKCSNTYFSESRHTEESNKKRSKSIKKFLEKCDWEYYRPIVKKQQKSRNINKQKYFLTECKNCRNITLAKYDGKIFCSRKCTTKFYISKRIKEGKHKGWTSRAKCNRSYAEVYAEELLSQMGFNKHEDYEPEYHQGKWFIDFAFVDKKIAIEIDGRQHELPERKIKDAEKDAWLIKNGWSVHRIKWRKLDFKTRKLLIDRLCGILDMVEIEIRDVAQFV